MLKSQTLEKFEEQFIKSSAYCLRADQVPKAFLFLLYQFFSFLTTGVGPLLFLENAGMITKIRTRWWSHDTICIFCTHNWLAVRLMAQL